MRDGGEPQRFAISAQRLFDGDAMRGPSIVDIADGRILSVGSAGSASAGIPVVTLPDDVVLAPGFVDLQVNGGGGVLLNDAPDASTIAGIAAAHLRHGTTALLPTLITDAPVKMERLLACARDAMLLPGVVGFHLEGPFISQARRGIHPAAHIRAPAPEDLELLGSFPAFGPCLATLAPECVPSGTIRWLAGAGFRVALGHSEATAAAVSAAADEGASSVTHLFNAMSQMSVRAAGMVGAALSDDRLHAGVICDGLHVDPANIRAAWRAMGPQRLFLVSDAMPTVGSDAGGFTLHGREIRLDNGRLTDARGTLAGAHLTMAEAVRNAVGLAGLPLADALRMATATPADYMGLGDGIGRIRAGGRADIVAFGDAGVVAVWKAGREVEIRAAGAIAAHAAPFAV